METATRHARAGGEPAAVNFSAPFEQLAEGAVRAAAARSPRPTSSRFAALTGDWHPQHADAGWAARQRVRRAHRPRDARRQLRRRPGRRSTPSGRRAAPHRATPSSSGRCASATRSTSRASSAERRDARRRDRRSSTLDLEDRQPGRRARLPRARRGALAPRRVAAEDPFDPGRRLRPDPAVMLDGKRLLITGVVTRDSIAFEVARQAQEAGAEVVLTGFGRARAHDRARRGEAARAGRRARARRQRRGRPRARSQPSSTRAGAASTACCTRSRSRRPTRSAAASSTPRPPARSPRSRRARSRCER